MNIIFILFILYSFYFYFLYKGGIEKIKKPGLHILISIPFALIVIAGIFWGYATKPYGDTFQIKSWLTWSRTDMEVYFFFPMAIAITFSYLAVYRLGEFIGHKNFMDSYGKFICYKDFTECPKRREEINKNERS